MISNLKFIKPFHQGIVFNNTCLMDLLQNEIDINTLKLYQI
jgi:hypothetical protein